MKGGGVSKTARASMKASSADPKGRRPVRVVSYAESKPDGRPRKREWTEWREPEA